MARPLLFTKAILPPSGDHVGSPESSVVNWIYSAMRIGSVMGGQAGGVMVGVGEGHGVIVTGGGYGSKDGVGLGGTGVPTGFVGVGSLVGLAACVGVPGGD